MPKNGEGPKRPRKIGAEDRRLWSYVTKDVVPLENGQLPDVEAISLEPVTKTKPRLTTALPAAKPAQVQNAAMAKDLDRRTEEKFRKGQLSFDLILDLHGYRAVEAQERLIRSVMQAHAAQKRCLLVITGKGSFKSNAEISDRENKGIIRRSLKFWLDDSRISNLVLSVVQAKPQHGGAGAFYILLRKRR